MRIYPKKTGSLCANSHPGSYCGQDAYNDMLPVIERGNNEMDIVNCGKLYGTSRGCDINADGAGLQRPTDYSGGVLRWILKENMSFAV